MPLYHFNVRGSPHGPDRAGSELANLDAVRLEAVARVVEKLRTDAALVIEAGVYHLDVTDAAHRIVYAVNVLAQDVPVEDFRPGRDVAQAEAPASLP